MLPDGTRDSSSALTIIAMSDLSPTLIAKCPDWSFDKLWLTFKECVILQAESVALDKVHFFLFIIGIHDKLDGSKSEKRK